MTEPGREVFESMLECAITNTQMAFEAAKGLNFFGCNARDIARQRRMNQMAENQVIAIEEMFNIVVALDRVEEHNKIPFPPRINREITLRNYRNGVGRSDNSRPADALSGESGKLS